MSNLLPPPNLGDDDKSRGTVQRTTVTFADNFDPRARDNSDSPTLGPRASINDSSRARSSASTSRRVSSGDAGTNSGSADDDDASRAARRTTGSFGPSVPTSRGAINPPFMWHPTGILYRFTILALVAFILLVGYFADETIGATTSELRKQLDFGGDEPGDVDGVAAVGWIYSASYGPNIIMVFLGGFLVDRFGVRIMSLIYSALVVLGLGMFALLPTFWGKVGARVIFGMGFEPLEVCSDAIVMRWYSSTRQETHDGRRIRVGAPSIPLAFSLLFSTGIFGQFLSLNILPSVVSAFNHKLTYVYLLVTAIAVVAFVVNIIYALMDFIASRTVDLENTVSESISFKVLTHFPLTYWLLMGVCVTGFACQYVFMVYACDYLHEKWGYTEVVSGNWASVVYLFAIVLSPVVGYFVERRGQGITLMGVGCLFFAFGCVIMGSITPNYLPAVPLILMGIAYSLVPATVWSAISDVIPEPLAGTGFGIMTAIMSFTYLIIPAGVGALHGYWRSYDNMNFLFAACAIIAFGLVLWIFKVEPDLNLPPRARRRDLSAYNVLTAGSDSEDEEEDEEASSPRDRPRLRQDEEFSLIRDRFAGPVSPQRRSVAVRKPMDETELLTVTEDEQHFQFSEDEAREAEMPMAHFSSSVIPESWLTGLKRGIDPVDSTVSSSLPM